MRMRRALAGLFAVGVTVMAAGSAEALSWRRATCEEFRSSALDHDAFVRARVARTWDARIGEWEQSAEVEATVREAMTGRLSRGTPLVFTARTGEIGGMPVGFIPAEGDEVVLFLNREPDRRWVVTSAMTADEYDRYWARRCAF